MSIRGRKVNPGLSFLVIYMQMVKWENGRIESHVFQYWLQCPGRFLGRISQNPSVSKSNRLRDVIFQCFFINWRYIP